MSPDPQCWHACMLRTQCEHTSPTLVFCISKSYYLKATFKVAIDQLLKMSDHLPYKQKI